MALVWLVLFLVAAAPANAASVGLAPASGIGGARPTLVATELKPRSLVGVKVGRRERADHSARTARAT